MQLGVVGLCASFIAGRLLLSLGYPWLVGRFLGVSLSRQLRRAIRPALATAALFAAGTLGSRIAAVDSWLALAALAGLTLGGAALAAFYGGLSGTQRQRVLDRVEKIARGRRP
jgi:hypothetical protein